MVGSMLDEACRISFFEHPAKATTITAAARKRELVVIGILFLANDEHIHH
jgi:hypothetical protein